MLKKILILLAIILVAGGVYLAVYFYHQWKRMNAELDSTVRNRVVFEDLCNTESKDRQCLRAVIKYFDECKKAYKGKITFINVRDESMKYLNTTYKCIEDKSHYKLPSLGDYLLDLDKHKTVAHKAHAVASKLSNEAEPSLLSGNNLSEKKEDFLKKNKGMCLKGMTSVESGKRRHYCDCAIASIRDNMKDSDFKLYLDKKIDMVTLMKLTGEDYDSCLK